MKNLKTLIKLCPDEIKDYLINFKIEPNKVIIEQGAKAKFVYFLLEGQVEVHRMALNGVKYLEYLHSSYEMFGELEVLNNKPLLASISTKTNCLLYKIDSIHFKKWLDIDKDFREYILFNLSQKLYKSCISSEVNIAYPLKYKILYYLYSQYKLGRRYIEKEELISAIAGKLRSANRIIKELVEEDVLDTEKGIVKILDIKKLIDIKNRYENN